MNKLSKDSRNKGGKGQEKGGQMTADCAGIVVRKDTSQHCARRIWRKGLNALDEGEEGAVEELHKKDDGACWRKV